MEKEGKKFDTYSYAYKQAVMNYTSIADSIGYEKARDMMLGNAGVTEEDINEKSRVLGIDKG